MFVVRAATETDHEWIVAAATEVLGSDYQVSSHRQFRVLDVDVLIVERDGEPLGFLGWEIDGDACEALAIACTARGAGAGTALMERLHELAAARGCNRVRVVTTDANTSAQRFYERLGYRLVARRRGAVDECRRLYKPEIPSDMHDELEYERRLAANG